MTFSPSLIVDDPARSRAWFVMMRGRLLVRPTPAGPELPADEDVVRLGIDPASGHPLGVLDGRTALAAVYEGERAALPPLEAMDLRTAVVMLGGELASVAMRANHVVDWATTSRYCGRCGTATVHVPGERCMACPACKLTVYPRIAPAVIMLVRRGEEALLARGTRFPLPFYSALAGFSEIGETLEQTVVREVEEEVGLRVGQVRYFGSQPWPFPNSLMIAFTAQWESGDLRLDPSEIADAGWYRRDALPVVPPPISIARQLIDAWVGDAR